MLPLNKPPIPSQCCSELVWSDAIMGVLARGLLHSQHVSVWLFGLQMWEQIREDSLVDFQTNCGDFFERLWWFKDNTWVFSGGSRLNKIKHLNFSNQSSAHIKKIEMAENVILGLCSWWSCCVLVYSWGKKHFCATSWPLMGATVNTHITYQSAMAHLKWKLQWKAVNQTKMCL